jgi:hypothetical protein
MSIKITLKHPLGSYQPRLTQFLQLMVRVRGLAPQDMHLWKVMDSVAFEDTETALQTTIFNESRPDTKRRDSQ